MLQKNYSKAVVGQSYLSFIYGIELLRHKHSVLLLDDERLQFGDLFNHGITQLDLEFFKVWGGDRDIICLQEVDRFLEKKPYTLIWGGKRIYLGEDVWSNLRELYRKLPNFFPFESFFFNQESDTKSNFVTDYNLLAQRLGINGFRFKGLENTTIEFLLGQCPQNIKDAFMLFKKSVHERKEDAWRFLYFARTIYHKRFASSFSDVELFHFFISILSPHYTLDDQALVKELSDVFVEKGGHFKETQVREWKFYKGLPWSMELASFEGIIHPQKISFLGSWPLGLPLKVKHGWRRYQSIHFSANCSDERLSQKLGEWVLWSAPERLGTDLPMWRLEVKEGKIVGQYFYRVKPGSKLNFYDELLSEELKGGLEDWLPGVADKLEALEFSLGLEVYLDQSESFKTAPLPKLKEVKLYDFSSPFLKNRLKNVTYFGPLKGSPLGLYGQLLELKEISKYQ
jgi:hypothetical protein